MIVLPRVKEFETLGFGMFVHFGIYSLFEQGEWFRHNRRIDPAVYEEAATRFAVHPDWARELVRAAKGAGCRYITLTTRHHDGFSLYDTRGLNEFDAPHTPSGRDLVREFVDACNEEGIVPFFYHTLLDWHHPEYESDFPAYLKYLRDSVEILCTQYGKIGGIWFDGSWSKPKGTDWEEDALYGMIRSHQPDAMIINNTGIGDEGALGHIELDSVTFERGRPQAINLASSPKYIASEMCQVMNDHWGYAAYDLNYKPFATLLSDLLCSRRYHANFLLNVGPMPNGMLRTIDRGVLELFGEFVRRNGEAIYRVHPCAHVSSLPSDFLLQSDTEPVFYYYAGGMGAPDGSGLIGEHVRDRFFDFDSEITSVRWLDTGEAVPFQVDGNAVMLTVERAAYGLSPTVRIARIEVKR